MALHVGGFDRILRLLASLAFVSVLLVGFTTVPTTHAHRLAKLNLKDQKSQLSAESHITNVVQLREATATLDAALTTTSTPPVGAELCSVDEPCPDGSCCGTIGICGYGPEFCGSGNCTSNCDATAMCGIYSANGNVSCGMDICCSAAGWCGTTSDFCINADPGGLTLPCQEGYGLCEIVDPPSCATSEDTTGGRTIGYYQGSNVYNRLCNTVLPSQITTDGYSHLYFAFASIDPDTFEVVASDDRDVDLYTQFTALKGPSLETWIAIGGFDFSDNDTATHYTWSDLAGSAANRAAFIASAMDFMDEYGFQGMDLDWEYPGATDRGGDASDTANYVELVKEMNEAFAGNYGLSLTLAPDYWYLRNFDAISMQPYVSWFGFMSYDLHGYWDADNANLGAIVRGQTNIGDIANDTAPLWFDGLDPSKINFGLALYGRGYTLSSPSCNTLGCAFSGPSDAGPCTNQAGVLSLLEIQQIIDEYSLTPVLLEDAMMKQITWLDQWIGYDDADTFALKAAWANAECFGGTMYWSVDFDSVYGSSLTPNETVTTDGTCGVNFGGTVCGDWSTGNCCSSAGYCGSGSLYCGNGCQSGDCIIGGQTTDGTCGAQNNDAICGNWTSGSCCSNAGYCGSTDDYCALDNCQSGPCGGGSGEIYPPPDIWSSEVPELGCYPPCTYYLPPITLGDPVTVTWGPVTTSIYSLVGAVTTIVTTIITIEPFIVSSVDFWPITIGTTDSFTGVIIPMQSVTPPFFTLGMPSDQASISQTFTVETIDGTTTTSVIPGPPVWGVGPSSFYPEATSAISNLPTGWNGLSPGQTGVKTSPTSTTSSTVIGIAPSPTSSRSVHFTQTKPGSSNSGCQSNCGTSQCSNGCDQTDSSGHKTRHCGLLGCDLCGILGCPFSCGLDGCVGTSGGHESTTNCGSCGGSSGDSSTQTTSECTEPKTISECEVICTPVTVTSSSTSYSCTTACETAEVCTGTDFATTTTVSTSAGTSSYNFATVDGDTFATMVDSAYGNYVYGMNDAISYWDGLMGLSDPCTLVATNGAVSCSCTGTAKLLPTLAANPADPCSYNVVAATGSAGGGGGGGGGGSGGETNGNSPTTTVAATTATTDVTVTAVVTVTTPEVTVTTTVPIETTPTTTPVASPSPVPTETHWIYVMLSELEINDGDYMYSYVREWQVFEALGDETIDECNTNPLTEPSASTSGAARGYPGIDLSFTAFDIEGCAYNSAGTDTIGTMTCPGVDSITCIKDPDWSDLISCGVGGDIWRDLVCSW
ncbi:hypothetical protein BX600DRAFT_511777 [Xylariales sp. PMI_506]|nr:hypothetical protein BX600DRAFT_511777 [Xylariales sp. PMI_506]